MIELLVLLFVFGLVASFLDLRWGLYATMISGFVQDPVRKLFVDEPIYLSAVVIVFAAVTFLGAKVKEVIVPLDAIPGWNERMQGPVHVFLILVILQSIATFFYTGSPMLAGIGLLAYLSPFPAFMMAYSFASGIERVTGFLWLYVFVCVGMASGVYLTSMGVELDLLRTVGEPLTIYLRESGEALDLPPGFFRVPELAAWHAAAAFCVCVILGLSGRRASVAWATGALALFFLGVVILTGRRKFIAEIAMFLPFVALLLIRLRAGSSRLLWLFFSVSAVAAIVIMTRLISGDTLHSLGEASSRSEQAISEEILERAWNLTVDSFEHVVYANGIFGSGAGSGSQGAQHFGGGDQIIGYAAEGGLGKILAELGVPGLAVVVWMGISFLAFIWKTLASLQKGGGQGSQIAIGLAAFLLATAIIFVSAHQSFGDLFVLLLIGTFFGFIAAAPRYSRETAVPDRHSATDNLAGTGGNLRASRFPR